MKLFLSIILIFSIFSCNSNGSKVVVKKIKDNIIIDEILIKLPTSWDKDKKLNLWREKKTGAILNIEIENSKLALKDYIEESLKIIRKTYSYQKIGERKGSVGNYNYFDSIAEVEMENRVMIVHSLVIDKKESKITITMAVNKDLEEEINKDFNYIINSLKYRKKL